MSRPWIRRLVLALAISGVIQIWIAVKPDTMGDVLMFRDWTRALTHDGIITAYNNHPELKARGTEIDYPPGYPYLLYALGKLLRVVAPQAFETNSYFVDSAIKLLSVVANLLIALLLFSELKQLQGVTVAVAGASAYAFNPAIIFNTAYWGQAESVSSLAVLASLILLRRDHPEWSWVLMILAASIKPLALPFLPLIFLATIKRQSLQRVITSAVAAVVTLVALILPFLLAGQARAILSTLLFQIDAMPYLSVNAHNLWWLIQKGRPWDVVTTGWKLLALGLFGLFYFFTLLRYWHSRKDNALYIAAASTAFGFFVLYTHMHENHLFQFIPLLSLFCFEDSRLRKIYLIVTLVFFMNMLLHDPFINHVLEPYSVGPKISTWAESPAHYPIYDTFVTEGKSYVVEETTGQISALRLLLSLINSELVCLLFLYWLLAFYFRGNSFDEQFHPEPLFTKRRVLVGLLFVAITSILYIVKLSQSIVA